MFPSGQQYALAFGSQRATVVEVGGGIREYWHRERAVLDPYPADRIADGGHGVPLIPWPGRVADGRYRFGDHEYQLDLTEPDKHNALHGLMSWRPWRAVERQEHRVVMAARLHPQPGYPFALDATVHYALGSEGLRVRIEVTNIGDAACPFAAGHHPYLSAGPGHVDEARLTVPAATRIVTDSQRLLPTGREAVAGTGWDFRAGRLMGPQHVDDCFTDLDRDSDDRAWIRLEGADGHMAELWMDRAFPVACIYTGDTLEPGRQRLGVAAEPFTVGPNALATGEGILVLEPGSTWVGEWGACLDAGRG